MHASAFLIRETKIGSSLCSVFPLRIFMGACNQEERFWNFYCGVVTRRHSFGFSRNNMKGALYHWRNQWVRNKKGKIFNFSFLALSGLRDEVPNVLRFLNEIEKRLTRHQILMEVQATISRTDLTKLQTLGSIILLSFFEY